MGDWIDNLDSHERAEWDAFVARVRRDALVKINDSAFVVSIAPDGAGDVKFAVELGLSIMLDKPILLVVHTTDGLPAKLRKVADKIVVCDIDTEAGRETLTKAMKAMVV